MMQDSRLDEAKAIPIREVVDRLGIAGLRRSSAELVGPCPLCGGTDRFAVNLRSHAFLCRRCDIRGGDGVALVQAVMGMAFRDALAWLVGEADATVDQAELDRRKAKAVAEDRRRAAETDRYRARAIEDARAIWRRAVPGAGTPAEAYLAGRGIALDPWPAALRFLPDHPYVKKTGGSLQTLHRGPCMIAGIMAPSGAITAVHQTWLDGEVPGRKARIAAPDGTSLPAKMNRGSKKGGAIRLCGADRAPVLVMGEGIETTLSAAVVDPIDAAAYWAGIDLGNMAGRAARVDGQRWHGLPDMGDCEAFVPPPWVERLIYLMDGDSEPRATRHKLECGLRRAMALVPGLRGQIVAAGDGVDFNDILMGAA